MTTKPAALLLTAALAAGCSNTGSQRLSSIKMANSPERIAEPGPIAPAPITPQSEHLASATKPEQTTAHRATETNRAAEAEHEATTVAQAIETIVAQVDEPAIDLIDDDPKPVQTLAAAPIQNNPSVHIEEPEPISHRDAVRERALSILEGAAFSEHAIIRANAIEALHTAPLRLAPILNEALSDQNPGVRSIAAMSIGKLRLAEFASDAMDLQRDADPRVRVAALYAQSRTGFKPDLTPIADLLFSSDPSIRSHAAFILGELGNTSALPMLRSVAASGTTGTLVQDRIFRLQVAEAMVKLGDKDASQTIHVALYPALRDEFEAAVLAAQILGELEDRQSIQQLVNVVEARLPEQATQDKPRRSNKPQPYLYPAELRLAAATSLAKMGYPDGVYVAEEYANHDDHLVRAQAVFLYAHARRTADLPTIVEMMDDPSPVVQTAAASSVLLFLAPDDR